MFLYFKSLKKRSTQGTSGFVVAYAGERSAKNDLPNLNFWFLTSRCFQWAVCVLSHTPLSMRRPTNVTSWASAQRCQFPPTSAPQVGGAGRLTSRVPAWERVFKQKAPLTGCVDSKSLFPTEFSVLVDLSSDRTSQNLAAGDDDVSSSYQFAISSASTQPTDRGECARLMSQQITASSFHSRISFSGLKKIIKEP